MDHRIRQHEPPLVQHEGNDDVPRGENRLVGHDSGLTVGRAWPAGHSRCLSAQTTTGRQALKKPCSLPKSQQLARSLGRQVGRRSHAGTKRLGRAAGPWNPQKPGDPGWTRPRVTKALQAPKTRPPRPVTCVGPPRRGVITNGTLLKQTSVGRRLAAVRPHSGGCKARGKRPVLTRRGLAWTTAAGRPSMSYYRRRSVTGPVEG